MIILVSGRAGEGKTTFSNMCIDYLNKNNKSCSILPFADGLKGIAKDIGWDGCKDNRGRKLLQDLGRIGREYSIDVWVGLTTRCIQDYMAEHLQDTAYIFIDDWRFPNELIYLRNLVYPIVTCKIKRQQQFHALFGTPLYNEVSEISLPTDDDTYYTSIIDNMSDLDALRSKAMQFVNKNLLTRRVP